MMRTDDEAIRIPNITGRGIAKLQETHCPWCCDEGWVIVDAGTPADQIEELHQIWGERKRQFVATHRRKPSLRESLAMRNEPIREPGYGPCPQCEAGFVNEHPGRDKAGRDLVPPWGRNGFWQGRTPDIAEACTCFDKPMPLEQVIEGMRQMAGVIGRQIAA